MPINARKKIRIGISKINPMPRIMLRNSDVYSEIVIMGVNWLPKPIPASAPISRGVREAGVSGATELVVPLAIPAILGAMIALGVALQRFMGIAPRRQHFRDPKDETES